ncbi:MAG: 50S ribosome-binding GTPase [Planctomycetota bacterium]|jgi:hypothetical protein|nr:50S ribosome-binding GTPase [Planctomycetota bacterium]
MGKQDDKSMTRDYGYGEHIDVCLIGPSGVGKTSLLATMYHHLQDYLPGNVQFKPLENELFVSLTRKYEGLAKMANVPPHSLAVDDSGGNMDIQTYPFGFNFVTHNGTPVKFLQVNFHDTPGGYTKTMPEKLTAKINSSQIIIVAVDAGAMMKATLSNANEFNGYKYVTHHLEETFVDARNRLVLFVPIKAETWIADWRVARNMADAAGNPLIQKAGEHLAQALKLFTGFNNRLGIVVPVETMGCVRYLATTFAPDGKGGEVIHYSRTHDEFRPRHIHFPLFYTLNFIAAEFFRNKGILWKFFYHFFGNYKKLLRALEKSDMGDSRPPVSFHGNGELLDSPLGIKKNRIPKADGNNGLEATQGG